MSKRENPSPLGKSGIQLNLNKKILWSMGMWSPKKSDKNYRIYLCHSIFITLGLFLHISSEILAVFKHISDFQLVANITCTMLSGICAFIKAVYFVYKSYEIQALVEALEGPMFSFHHQSGEEQKAVIKRTTRIAYLITAAYETLCVFIVTLYMATPLIFDDPTNPLERPLPLYALFPFDITTSPGYEAAYAFIIVTCYITTSVIGGVDMFCVSTMIHVAGQLESLAVSMETIVETVKQELRDRGNGKLKITKRSENDSSFFRTKDGSQINETNEDTTHSSTSECSGCDSRDLREEYTEAESIAYKRLKECVDHHEAILNFSKEVQRLFSPVMLLQCCSSTLILCFIALLTTESSGNTGSLIKNIVYLVHGTSELGLFCLFGDRVMQLSGRIAEAAYNCDWSSTSIRFRKSLVMIIMRAQSPITFKGGFLYAVSLETFASLINASYSYYTILRRAKE